MIRLLCRLGARLRHDGYFAHSLRAHINHARGNSWHEEIALPCVQDTPTLLTQFQKLWSRRILNTGPPFKVGVEVAGLVSASQVPRPLFDDMEKPGEVFPRAVDQINQRLGGRRAIYFGLMQDFRHAMDDKIAFGRIPPMTQ